MPEETPYRYRDGRVCVNDEEARIFLAALVPGRGLSSTYPPFREKLAARD